MSSIVVVHVDSLRREYPSAWILARRLEQAGCHVILTSRISTRHLLRVFTPDILILSHPFIITNEQLDRLLSRGAQVYVNEVEGVLEDDAAISSTYPPELMDYNRFTGVFVWNTWSRDWLVANRGMDPARIHAVGSIRNNLVDAARSGPAVPTVGILGRFEVINTFDGRHPFHNLLSIDPEDTDLRWYLDRCAIDAEAFAIVAKLIGILTARGIRVSIRPHPNERLRSYDPLRRRFGPLLTIDSSYDVTEWLGQVSVVVGPTSTAYTEAYRARIPLVSTQRIQRCHYTGTARIRLVEEFSQAAHLPSTVEEAASMCMDPSLPAKMSPVLDRYFAEFYRTDAEPDPIGRIVERVTGDRAGRVGASNVVRPTIGLVLKGLIDCVNLGRALFRRHPVNYVATMRQYDYNSVLHRPNAHMRELARRIRPA